MFKGYKLEKICFNNLKEHYFELGSKINRSNKRKIQDSLDSFFQRDDSLDGSLIIDNWFPQIDVNIFISHSHKDESEVIVLSGWLYDNFNIKSFIDSCVWGYGNTLTQMLDNEFSWMDSSQGIYYYDKVLQSTSHVHMMLSSALSAMIDRTECLFFYDTPNSIEPFETIDKTESPWIFSEIAFSQIVRQKIPDRIKKQIKESKYLSADGIEHFEKTLKVKYDIDTTHLKKITSRTLNLWAKNTKCLSPEEALDELYEITFPISQLLE